MQKKYILIPLIALTCFLTSLPYLLSPIFAASPSPSISPSPTPSEQDVTDNLKKRLQESLDSKTPTTSPILKAYIGVVKDIIKDTVIIEDKTGKKDIKLTEDTTILRSPGSASIKPENIRIDDYIIAIGYLEGDTTLAGRRLIVSVDPIKSPNKLSGIGTIEKISKTGITLKLVDKSQTITTTSKTIYKSTVGTIEPSDLAIGDTLIYTATLSDEDLLTATIFMRTKTGSI
jgi:hypothetical protein